MPPTRAKPGAGARAVGERSTLDAGRSGFTAEISAGGGWEVREGEMEGDFSSTGLRLASGIAREIQRRKSKNAPTPITAPGPFRDAIYAIPTNGWMPLNDRSLFRSVQGAETVIQVLFAAATQS